MNFSSKYRIHMGCGEPLQSRWWVTQVGRTLLPGDQGRAGRQNRRNGPLRPGGKCKA